MFKVGDKVKINVKKLNNEGMSDYSYNSLCENKDVIFNVTKIFPDNIYPIEINTEVIGITESMLFEEEELIIAEEKPIKNGSQVKLNHEVLEQRIHELDLAFVGHSKLNPNFIYTVVGKQHYGEKFIIASYTEYQQAVGVLWEYLEKDELILMDGE